MSTHGSTNSCTHEYRKGDEIEVLRNAADGDVPVWFPATVIDSPSPAGTLHVKFSTLYTETRRKRKKIRDYVNASDGVVRPVPTADPHHCFVIGEEVEVFHETGWWRGEVKDVLEDSKVMVAIGGVMQVTVEKRRVRVFSDWKEDDGSHAPSPLDQHQEKSLQLDLQSKKRTKLRILCSRRTSPTLFFYKGTMVEVKRSEESYRGSLYTAFIVESLQNNNFLVEYLTLTTNDKTRPLRETVDASCIRPIPPQIESHDRYEELEHVDCFYNDGWWMGTITDILDQFQYLVYFSTTDELMRFGHSELRPHQEWIDQEWVTTSDLESLKLKQLYGQKRKEAGFSEGTRVEVRSDEDGYHGCWYAATVVGSEAEGEAKGKLLVQYDTLTTDDGVQPLVETAYGSNLRPVPPMINRCCRFNMLEVVDAWYNDGWWVGIVSKVLGAMKYVVYFWTTNEELLLEHSKLRPHQEFVDKKWVPSFLRPKLAAKPRLEKVKIQTGGRTLMAGLLRGLKVEIAHGVVGHVTTWYPAVILGPGQNGKYLVEYWTLKTDKGRELVKEEVDPLFIRPSQPIIQRPDRFQLNDQVDAWEVIGWQSGQICRTVNESKYAVYLRATDAVDEFWHADLRPSQDFIDGLWSRPAKVRIDCIKNAFELLSSWSGHGCT